MPTLWLYIEAKFLLQSLQTIGPLLWGRQLQMSSIWFSCRNMGRFVVLKKALLNVTTSRIS